MSTDRTQGLGAVGGHEKGGPASWDRLVRFSDEAVYFFKPASIAIVSVTSSPSAVSRTFPEHALGDVVERLLQDPLPGFNTVRLLGNHEEAMLDFLDERSDGLDWLSYGGLETLLSYGVPLRSLPNTLAASVELRRALAAALPKSHEAFYRACALHHAVGDYVFVHAGIRPGISLEKQDPADLMWIRDDFLRSRTALPGRIVVQPFSWKWYFQTARDCKLYDFKTDSWTRYDGTVTSPRAMKAA